MLRKSPRTQKKTLVFLSHAISSLIPNRKHSVLITNKSSGLLAIKPRILPSRFQRTITARDIINVSPGRPFIPIFNNVSKYEVHLLKNIKIAHIANARIVINAVGTSNRNTDPIETPDKYVKYIALEVSASNIVKHQTSGSHDFFAVH